jgi:hypothetical protein
MSTEAKANKPTGGYCLHCSKVTWHTWESAKLRVEELKSTPRDPETLSARRIPVSQWLRFGHVSQTDRFFIVSICGSAD